MDPALLSQLRQDKLPKHLAIVMDGNGRWAQRRNLPRNAGHRAGVKSVDEIVVDVSSFRYASAHVVCPLDRESGASSC